MKQTNLLTYNLVTAERACLGKLAVVWTFYGLAMAGLWQARSGSVWSDAMLWAVAVLIAIGFALGTGGFEDARH